MGKIAFSGSVSSSIKLSNPIIYQLAVGVRREGSLVGTVPSDVAV